MRRLEAIPLRRRKALRELDGVFLTDRKRSVADGSHRRETLGIILAPRANVLVFVVLGGAGRHRIIVTVRRRRRRKNQQRERQPYKYDWVGRLIHHLAGFGMYVFSAHFAQALSKSAKFICISSLKNFR